MIIGGTWVCVCCLVFFVKYENSEVFYGVLMYIFHEVFGVFF